MTYTVILIMLLIFVSFGSGLTLGYLGGQRSDPNAPRPRHWETERDTIRATYFHKGFCAGYNSRKDFHVE